MVAKNKKLLNDDLENMHLMPSPSLNKYRNFDDDSGNVDSTGDSMGGGLLGGLKDSFGNSGDSYGSTGDSFGKGVFGGFNDNWFDTDSTTGDSGGLDVGNISSGNSGGGGGGVGKGLKAAGGTVSGAKKTTGTSVAGGMWQSALKAITDSINKGNTSKGSATYKTNSSGVQIPSESNSGGDGLSTMAVVGIVVGGVAVLGTIIFLASRTTTTTPYTPTPMLQPPMLPATTK